METEYRLGDGFPARRLIRRDLRCVFLLQSAGQPQQHFMHAAPGSTAYCPGGGGATSQALAAATAVLADSGILALPPHRNMSSSHRPASAGNTGEGSFQEH